MAAVAELRDLTVRYGAFTALDGFTADIQEGCTGLLGPNGAGKTTLIKTLLGFVRPAQGGGNVLGHPLDKESPAIRQTVGYMPEQDCHIPGMSGVHFVAFAGELAGLPPNHALRRAHEVLEYCGLGEARYRMVETYSTGMKQRIKLAQALVHGPKLLLLDEPTNGLDPRGREEMLALIRSISASRLVHVLLSSHLLKDIERICDQVIVVMQGQLRASGRVRDFKSVSGHPIDVSLREFKEPLVASLRTQGMSVVERNGEKLRIEGPGTPDEQAKAVFLAASQAGCQVRSLGLAQRSLEEAFLEAVRG